MEAFAIVLREILQRQGHQDLLDKMKLLVDLIFPLTVFTGTTPELFLLQFLLLDQGIVTDFYDPPPPR